MQGGGDSWGRELFLSFVPPSARARAHGIPVLSGALVARHQGALSGPVVELPLLPRAALAGILRAAKHADAIVAVAVDADARSAAPDAARRAIDDVISAARECQLDRPIVLVARAVPFSLGARLERLSEGLYRDLEAGFTSFGFDAAAFAGDVEGLARLCAPLLEQDLGLELEIDEDRTDSFDPALLLASLDDTLSRAALSLAAVRGASADDELGGGLLVTRDDQPRVRRVLIGDAFLPVVQAARDPMRMELSCFEAAEALLPRIGARGVAGQLLDALAREG